MNFPSISIYPNWEVAFYTALLLALWLLLRLFAASFTKFINYFRDQTLKVDPYLNGVKYPVSYWTERGGRPYQEDRYHAMKSTNNADVSLYGIFDGHGGYQAAQFCREYLLQAIGADTDWESNPTQTISRCFHSVDREFSAKARAQSLNDGTTAITAAFHNGKIIVGNAGDSRAVLVHRGGRVTPMSIDHHPDRKDEETRIRKLGGKLIHWGRWRVEGVLAVSRAIGDVSLQPYITCEPEIMEKKIDHEDEYLVIASDGLWDVLENEDVGKLVTVYGKDFIHLAKMLCTEALKKGSSDNITALVIDVKKRDISLIDSLSGAAVTKK